MTDYSPIDCGLHSEYELAIMHRRRLKLRWRDDSGVTHTETLLPVDLQTRNGEEFLIAENRDGERVQLRLDRVERAEIRAPDAR